MAAPPAPGAAFDPRELFENPAAPLEMEIGCGKGGFLLRQAQAHPDVNFFGVEWANEFYKFTADRMARWGVANVRVMRTDAKVLVTHHLVPGCLAALHVYHPDPWPKKRHHKRRLFTPDFMEAVVRALVAGGRLVVQTDHAEYFEQIQTVIRARPEIRPAAFEDVVDSESPQTNYEIKYEREQRPIYRIAGVRAP